MEHPRPGGELWVQHPQVRQQAYEVSAAARCPAPRLPLRKGGVFWGKRAARTPRRQNLRPTASWAGWKRLLERGPAGVSAAREPRPAGAARARAAVWPGLAARPAATSLQKAIYCTDNTLLVQPTLLVTVTATATVSGLPAGREVGLPQGQHSLCPGHCGARTGPVAVGSGGAEAREPPPTSRGSAKDGEAAHANLGESQRQPAFDTRGSETVQGGTADTPRSPRTAGQTPDLRCWRDPEGPRAPGGDVRSGQPRGGGGGERSVRAAGGHPTLQGPRGDC